MPVLKAGMAVAAVIIGAISALFGIVLLVSALRSGAIEISYGIGANVIHDTANRSVDAAHYWQLLVTLGLAPLVIGLVAVRWGWRAIKAGATQ